MSPNDNIVTDQLTDSIPYQLQPTPSKDELKKVRLGDLKRKTEAKLQLLLIQASDMRKRSADAKTKTKQQYYEKKFQRLNSSVRGHVSMLQQVEHLIRQQEMPIDSTAAKDAS